MQIGSSETLIGWISVAGVLYEPFSQLTPLSEVAVQACQSRLEPCLYSYVAWLLRRAGWAE